MNDQWIFLFYVFIIKQIRKEENQGFFVKHSELKAFSLNTDVGFGFSFEEKDNKCSETPVTGHETERDA